MPPSECTRRPRSRLTVDPGVGRKFPPGCPDRSGLPPRHLRVREAQLAAGGEGGDLFEAFAEIEVEGLALVRVAKGRAVRRIGREA
jgi:hypothetical protein